jgi:threonine dehydratase
MTALPTIEDARAAQELLRGQVHRTPTWRSTSLSERVGADVRLKLELFQKTGSFKARGATNKVASLTDDERARGVIAVSAGNHAGALAYAASRAGVRSLIVTWETASEVKLAAARAYGGETLRRGKTPLDAFAAMRELMAERGMVLAHPFDDPKVIAGQATVGIEIVEDVPDVAAVVVPIGGGGLISGTAMAIKALRPQARVIGIEPEGAPTLTRALEQGGPVNLTDIDTIADGLAAPMSGELSLELIRRNVDDVILLPDAAFARAMGFLAERQKVMAEPAGAAAVAALLDGAAGQLPDGPVVAVVSGGNVDPRAFSEIVRGGDSTASGASPLRR